jgi:hypothetical protein
MLIELCIFFILETIALVHLAPNDYFYQYTHRSAFFSRDTALATYHWLAGKNPK